MPREAADAWRRVLRMKPGDADAQAGLERAKADMNNKRKAEAASRTSTPDEIPRRLLLRWSSSQQPRRWRSRKPKKSL